MINNKIKNNILVSIPHSGIYCPREIELNTLSDNIQELSIDNVDWYTELIYDFRDILENKQIVFPINQIYINVNRRPYLEECMPSEINGLQIYKDNLMPDIKLQKYLIKKYHLGYHNNLMNIEKVFILDGHSTITGLTDDVGNKVQDDIIIYDFQNSKLDPPTGVKSAPEGFLESYAEALTKSLPNLRIALNTTYTSTYGHILATHGWDGKSKKSHRAPLILQETNENLYINNYILDIKAVEELRRTFADSIVCMLNKMKNYLS